MRLKLQVLRNGPTDKQVTFRYTTVNGVAKKDLHFFFKSETVCILFINVQISHVLHFVIIS